MEFQEIAYVNPTLVEYGGFLGDGLPLAEGLAGFVRIWEKDDSFVAKWSEKTCMKHGLAATGEPDVIWK